MLFTGSVSKSWMENLLPTLCASLTRVGCTEAAATSTGKAPPGLLGGKPVWPRLPSECKDGTILRAQLLSGLYRPCTPTVASAIPAFLLINLEIGIAHV